MKAVIASGQGRYADPWHPFGRTSPILAEVLRDSGFDVVVDDDIDHAMSNLAGVDLLVVNAGDPWRGTDPDRRPPGQSLEGFRDALQSGIGILAMHCAVASLRDYPEWAPAVGAIWVPGASFHPDASVTRIIGESAAGASAESFELFDERYCRLQQFGRSAVLATHEGPSSLAPREPSAWLRTHQNARVAVDVLGHDERSYDSPGHRQLITQLARWATSR